MNPAPIDPKIGAVAHGDSPRAAATDSASAGGAVFQALLERLANSTQRLEAREESVTDASSLAGAVEDARQTLGDALSLKEQLLEAYRQRRTQSA
jgi:hypothetical protein